ncbi:hypothetical protein BJ508DRAFT_331723 [Ascobolus immersus RN42]|uniref:Uncharacterized protein n=1 Tax=Ascobolus immersus RN42 TaxID=1160509 RepID=A0A3N4HV05_ASCIM|nr:hypothetical protein BJ508DRAFT_331723 [Ascobolus immersus RN42]
MAFIDRYRKSTLAAHNEARLQQFIEYYQSWNEEIDRARISLNVGTLPDAIAELTLQMPLGETVDFLQVNPQLAAVVPRNAVHARWGNGRDPRQMAYIRAMVVRLGVARVENWLDGAKRRLG